MGLFGKGYPRQSRRLWGRSTFIKSLALAMLVWPLPLFASVIAPTYGEVIFYPDTRYRNIPAFDLFKANVINGRPISLRISTESRFYHYTNYEPGIQSDPIHTVRTVEPGSGINSLSTNLSISLVRVDNTQITLRVPYYIANSYRDFSPESALGDIYLGLSKPIFGINNLQFILSGGVEIPINLGDYYQEKNPYKSHAIRIPISASVTYFVNKHFLITDITLVGVGSTERLSIESVSGPITIGRTGGYIINGMVAGGIRFNKYLTAIGLSITDDLHSYIIEPLRTSTIYFNDSTGVIDYEQNIIEPSVRSKLHRQIVFLTTRLSMDLSDNMILDFDLSYDLSAQNSFYGFSPTMTLVFFR